MGAENQTGKSNAEEMDQVTLARAQRWGAVVASRLFFQGRHCAGPGKLHTLVHKYLGRM